MNGDERSFINEGFISMQREIGEMRTQITGEIRRLDEKIDALTGLTEERLRRLRDHDEHAEIVNQQRAEATKAAMLAMEKRLEAGLTDASNERHRIVGLLAEKIEGGLKGAEEGRLRDRQDAVNQLAEARKERKLLRNKIEMVEVRWWKLLIALAVSGASGGGVAAAARAAGL